jgi:hypothetical protein
VNILLTNRPVSFPKYWTYHDILQSGTPQGWVVNLKNKVGNLPENGVGNLAEKSALKVGHFRENSQK